MSAVMKREGFKFVGPVTCYSLMQVGRVKPGWVFVRRGFFGCLRSHRATPTLISTPTPTFSHAQPLNITAIRNKLYAAQNRGLDWSTTIWWPASATPRQRHWRMGAT